MPSLGDIDGFERQLRDAVRLLNKRKIAGVTLVEAVDEADLWPGGFEGQPPFLAGHAVESILSRAPLYVCAIASEIGFRFEGVGTEYWNKLAGAVGVPVTMADRARIGDTFATLAEKYALSRPTHSAFSSHFSIISWPIANALLPLDLVGPVTRLLARAPASSLPGPGKSINFASLRAWASAAEGARLADWLRFEAASERVLTALLTENRNGGISPTSYARLSDTITSSSEAFFAARAARARARRSRSSDLGQESLGRLILTREGSGVKLFATWPPLPGDLADEARTLARAAGWRPQLWGAGPRLHSDTALGEGPFALLHESKPASDQPAFGDAAETFGQGSLIAAALAGRGIDWNETILFDVEPDRTRGHQRFSPFDAKAGFVWIATSAAITSISSLRQLGAVAGYRIYEADLAAEADRAMLAKEGLLAAKDRVLVARHPIDAIAAPQGVVRPARAFVLYRSGPPLSVEGPQKLQAGDRIGHTAASVGQPRLRAEPRIEPDAAPVSLALPERDAAFSALLERRLALRIESPHALRNVTVTADLEVDGKLLVSAAERVDQLPATLDAQSAIGRALCADPVRKRLIELGRGELRFTVGRLASIEITLSRPVGSVDWSTQSPRLLNADIAAELVCAPASTPHRFSAATSVVAPARGATGYALLLSDGRIADPIHLLAASEFNLGDFTAIFGQDLGSRQFSDKGRGSGDLARARVAWARAECTSLQAVAAKYRVVRQFEEPLVSNLCGRDWCALEQADSTAPSDPHLALYEIALREGMASLPPGTPERFGHVFAEAFAAQARLLDPDWPIGRALPLDGAMDDALNTGFTDAVTTFHAKGELLDVDPEDCDFGSTDDEWATAAAEAIRRIRRSKLVKLIAPSAGGRKLRDRYYTNASVAEMAEDLAAWTATFALGRGQLSPETAAAALQLWLSPAACDALDPAMRVLINDPFVARASRYAAIRMHTTLGGAVS